MSKKLKLTDREWREFVFGELFDISSTSSSIDKKRLTGILGNNPYITRSENNNGIDRFIDKQACFLMDEANVITIGLDTQTVFYQSYPFYTGQNIQVVRHPQLNKHNALFVIRIIKILVQKFSWGSYGATLTRLRRGKLFLPVDTNHLPDWAFMEAYMKQVEEELLAEALPKLEQQLLDDIITLGALDDREWREFKFEDVFNIVDGYYNKKPPMVDNGTLPFLGATQYNNGVTGMTTKNSVRVHDKVGGDSINDVEKRFYVGGCIAITNNGSVGHAYYQASKFTCSHDITVVYLKDQVMTKELATFLIPSVQKAGESFAYAKKWRPIRMKRSKLMLPIQADGTPDWEFMSAFMKRVEQETLLPALRHFKSKKCNQMLMGGGGKIRPYFMEDVVQIINGVRLTKADMTAGSHPFVGASEGANGVTEFVGNINASLDSNVLGVNYNGSVGFSFYHPYEALFSDDVKRVRWKDETANNKYTLLYLTTAITQQRDKYAYGYKFNAQRMKRQIIMLPSLPDGTPDFAYMEHTMRVMEYDVLRTYLNSISV